MIILILFFHKRICHKIAEVLSLKENKVPCMLFVNDKY
jgi:hypothetical protein